MISFFTILHSTIFLAWWKCTLCAHLQLLLHKHGVGDIASLLGVLRHPLLLSGVFYYCILWTVINSWSNNHSTGRQLADVPAMKSDRLNFANTNLLILKFPNWFEISYIARDYTKNFQMIRSWSQIPPPGYREVEVLRKRGKSSQGPREISGNIWPTDVQWRISKSFPFILWLCLHLWPHSHASQSLRKSLKDIFGRSYEGN